MAAGKRKESKPYAEFPLWKHPNGQWAKKIYQKVRYFGTDADAALKKFKEQVDDLQAGREPRQPGDTLTVPELVNAFLNSKKTDQNAGALSGRTFNDYLNVGKTLAAFFGNLRVDQLRPDDFERYRAVLAKTREVVSMRNSIVRAKAFFNWAYQNEKIDKPVRFGTAFKQPSKTALRRAKTSGKTFDAAALRKIIESAQQPLKAMILLGVNAGFGATDIANLPIEKIDLAGGWVSFPRPKTAILRRCPLWPETVAALKDVKKAIEQRAEPAIAADADLLFLTQRGARWVRGKPHEDGRIVFIDSVSQEFNKLLLKLDLKKRGSFYNLRHTFATAAAAVNDREAVDVIMGHVDPSMGANYVERFPDARLQAIVDAVRSWLWPQKKPSIARRK